MTPKSVHKCECTIYVYVACILVIQSAAVLHLIILWKPIREISVNATTCGMLGLLDPHPASCGIDRNCPYRLAFNFTRNLRVAGCGLSPAASCRMQVQSGPHPASSIHTGVLPKNGGALLIFVICDCQMEYPFAG